jgi:ankyrin repeat protein
MADPKTRRPIIQLVRHWSGMACVYLGGICHSQRLARLAISLGRENFLHDAAFNGYLKIAQALINAGANVNAQNNDWTPLHLAAEQGHLEVVRVLITAHANVNAQNVLQRTPLHLAAFDRHIEVVQALINAGANVNAQDVLQSTPLYYAASREVAQALIAAGADVNAQDNNQRTPLHHAAFNGRLETVRALIAAGANLKAQDNHNRTPIYLARIGNHQDVVDYFNDLPRLTAALQAAVQEQNLTTIQDLIRQGAPLVDDQGNSIFEHIIGAYNLAQPTEDDTFAREVIRILGPMAGTVRNREGRTALHIAAICGNSRIAKCLVRHGGADINAQDHGGNTPLHYAYTTRFEASTYQDRQYQGLVHKMRDDLLLLGANPSIRNRELKTAFLMHDNWRDALYAATHPADQAPAQ